MKTVFDQSTRDELISRINKLDEHSTAQWGKMNISQMLKHCTRWDAWVQGSTQYKQTFIGRIFGKLALKNVLKDEKPLGKNSPSFREFIIKESHADVKAEKEKWAALLAAYANFANPDFVHTFFGRMTKEQTGQLAYKHTDHHLRQFNC